MNILVWLQIGTRMGHDVEFVILYQNEKYSETIKFINMKFEISHES